MLPQHGAARFREFGAVADWPVNQRVVEGELEDALDAGDRDVEPDRPPALSHRHSQRGEVLGCQPVDGLILAEVDHDEIGNLPVVREHPPTDLTCLQLPRLRGQKSIAEIGDGEAIAREPRGSPGVEIVGLNLILFECLLPTVALDPLHTTVYYPAPAPEVVDLAANLLHPLPARVRRQREFRVGLRGLAARFTRGLASNRLVQGASSASRVGDASLPSAANRRKQLLLPPQCRSSTHGSTEDWQEKWKMR